MNPRPYIEGESGEYRRLVALFEDGTVRAWTDWEHWPSLDGPAEWYRRLAWNGEVEAAMMIFGVPARDTSEPTVPVPVMPPSTRNSTPLAGSPMAPKAPTGVKRGLEPPPAALEAMDQQDVASGAKRQRGEEVVEEVTEAEGLDSSLVTSAGRTLESNSHKLPHIT